MTKYLIATLSLFAIIFSNQSFAAVSPVSVAIAPPIQFPPGDFNVTGVRASLLWGKHRSVYGIDAGLLGNITEQTFTGIAVAGGFNKTGGTTTILGLQFAGGANINTNKTTVVGVQAAIGMNYNTAAATVTGLQFALVNISPFTDIYGFQVGMYNKAKEVYGIQLGLVNVADNLHGIQIGLVNFNAKGPFAISPILNVGF